MISAVLHVSLVPFFMNLLLTNYLGKSTPLSPLPMDSWQRRSWQRMIFLSDFESLNMHSIHSIVASKLKKKHIDLTRTYLFAFTWHHIFYLDSPNGSCLGNIPIAGSIDMDIRKLHWSGIFHRPQGLTPHDQRKHVLGPLLGLAYFHCSPFFDGRLLCPEQFPNSRLPIESSADLDATELMDPEGRS